MMMIIILPAIIPEKIFIFINLNLCVSFPAKTVFFTCPKPRPFFLSQLSRILLLGTDGEFQPCGKSVVHPAYRPVQSSLAY